MTEQPGTPARVVALPRFFVGLAGVCVATMAPVALLGREAQPRDIALVLLAVGAVVSGLLALLHRRPLSAAGSLLGTLGVVLLGAPSAAIGWFFGPQSGYGTFIALALIVTGVLSGKTLPRFPSLAGWATYVSLAGGQGAVFGAVIIGVLADSSLAPSMVPGHPTWHYVAGHLFLQLIYLAAFLVGQRFQRRYDRLARDLDVTVRATGRRDALLGEARAEYLRTLELGRAGLLSGRKVGQFRLGRIVSRKGAREVYEAVDGEGTAASVLVEAGADGLTAVEEIDVDRPGEPRSGPGAGRPSTGSLAETIAGNGSLDAEALSKLVWDLCASLDTRHDGDRLFDTITPSTVLPQTADDGTTRWTLSTSSSFDPGDASAVPYVAPERLRGRTLSAASDTYSVVAVLYEAVTGVPPFYELMDPALPEAVLGRLPIAPRRFAHVPAPIEAVLRIGLARKSHERFHSASALRNAFVVALDGDPEGALAKRCRGLSHDWERGTKILAALSESRDDPTALDEGAPEADTELSPSPPRDSVTNEESRPSRSSSVRTDAWRAAYRAKVRDQRLGVIALCGTGAGMLYLIARNPMPFYVAVSCIVGILLVVLLGDLLTLTPWVFISVLSVGPLYATGLHSGLAAMVALVLFAGGIFLAGNRDATDGRSRVLWALIGTQTAVFLGILGGWIPDDGNIPVFDPAGSTWEAVVSHALIMGVYAMAQGAATFVDGRYAALSLRAEVAGRAAAHQELLLTEAREELDLLSRAAGIFTGLRVARYELGELLGRGGMGEVYAARVDGHGERVALKLVRGDRAASPTVLRLFLEEAEAMRRVDSPYVARVVEVADLEHDLPFIAMELVDGRSLTAILRERERLDLDGARRLARDMARGLGDVHAAKVLHCDIKPGNVLFTDSVGWKLVDFGVARRVGGELSRTARAGTAAYMAPEHAYSEGVDERSDLYSLCLVLYRALVGRPAYTGRDPEAVALAARETGPPNPARWVELPEDVRLALRVGLAADPGDRYQSAGELGMAFDQAFEARLSPEIRARAARMGWA